jgi:hypothetical protein
MSIFVCSFQQYYYYYTKDPVVYLGLFGFIGSMFAIGLAVGVFLATFTSNCIFYL